MEPKVWSIFQKIVGEVETYNKGNQFPTYMPMYLCTICNERKFSTMATRAYNHKCGKCYRLIREAKERGGARF